MKVDPQARSRLFDYLINKRQKTELNQSLQKLADNLKPNTQPLQEIKQAIEQSSDFRTVPLLERLVNSLSPILEAIKSLRIELPKIYSIQGTVKVDSPIQVSNWTEIQPYFDNLSTAIKGINTNLKVSLPEAKTPDINFPSSFNLNRVEDVIAAIDQVKLALLSLPSPKPVSIPKSFSVDKFDELLDGIEQLKNGFNILINKEAATIGFPDKDIPVTVTNFKYPAPVTHMSLNSLKGPILSTAVDVGTSATPLPATPVEYRRSVVVYNNGASTIYLGGEGVTVANGMPIPAGTYGPALDSGVGSIVYGIVATGTVEARVLESSDYDMGF